MDSSTSLHCVFCSYYWLYMVEVSVIFYLKTLFNFIYKLFILISELYSNGFYLTDHNFHLITSGKNYAIPKPDT